MVYFMAIDKCKFRRKVISRGRRPGWSLNHPAAQAGGKVSGSSAASASVEGEMAAESLNLQR